MAKLTAMGFKLGPPQYIPGEEDWVYGILVKGRHVVAGDKVSIDAVLTIQVGNGQRDAADSINFVEPMDAHDDLRKQMRVAVTMTTLRSFLVRNNGANPSFAFS